MSAGSPLSRREALRALAGAGAVAAVRPASVAARAPAPALGRLEDVEATVARLFGGRPMQDGAGAIRFEAPAIAENGAAVPVSIEVESPMTAADHVRHIVLLADRNPVPLVTRATLTPASGRASLGATIRLAETTAVRIVVERSDGTLLQLRREVRVTVSGCA